MYVISGTSRTGMPANRSFDKDLGPYYYACVPIDLKGKINNRKFSVEPFAPGSSYGNGLGFFTISEDSQTITEYRPSNYEGVPSVTYIYKRIK
jgi:hypothetical protein